MACSYLAEGTALHAFTITGLVLCGWIYTTRYKWLSSDFYQAATDRIADMTVQAGGKKMDIVRL